MSEKIHLRADDGERLDVTMRGQGTPIVLLHGWSASHAAWAPLVEPMSQHHRVIRPDARGHGQHRLTIRQAPDLARLARDLLNLLDQLDIEQAVVAGHSMGALTLWQFIGDFGTARLSRLCFIDQSPKLVTDAHWRHGIYGDFDAERSARFIAELQTDPVEAILRLVACGLNEKALASYQRNSTGWRVLRQELAKLDPAPLIAIWQSLTAADLRPVLPRIDRPTLLAYGGASNFYTDATARYVADRIRGAVLRIYDGADHCPHLLYPERFVADFTALINSPTPAPAATA